jgi:hypothetical protein
VGPHPFGHRVGVVSGGESDVDRGGGLGRDDVARLATHGGGVQTADVETGQHESFGVGGVVDFGTTEPELVPEPGLNRGEGIDGGSVGLPNGPGVVVEAVDGDIAGGVLA